MSIKKIVFALIVLLILAGMFITKHMLIKTPTEIQEYHTLDWGILPSRVCGFVIERAGRKKSLRIIKEGDVWVIVSHWGAYAKKRKVEDFIKQILSLEAELRSSSKGLLADYGLEDSQAFRITLLNKDSKPLLELLIGTKKPSYGASFIRERGSSRVYLVNKDLLFIMGIYNNPQKAEINIEPWIDLRLFNTSAGSIKSLEISKFKDNKEVLILDLKRNGGWQSSIPLPFDLSIFKVNSFLNTICGLRAQEVVNLQKHRLESPCMKIELTTDETSCQALIFKKDGKNYVKITKGPVYLVSQDTFSKIDKDMREFLPDNPLKIGSKNISEIIVRSGRRMLTLTSSLLKKNQDFLNVLKGFKVKEVFPFGVYNKYLESPPFWLKITYNSKKALVLEVMPLKGKVLCRIQGTRAVFSIEPSLFDKIFKELRNLNLSKNTS